MKKVLIANRGEIAVRIIQSLKELNIQSVAVYSTADRDSLHVALADESYCIGPAATAESYLDIKKILQVAQLADADAVHPGYGFLAESEKFARACEKEGLIFIGPTAATIELMGDKSQAKETAEENGLPVVPGSDGIIRSREHAHQVAESIGFPLVIKAVSGGGGKGMRVVQHPEDFDRLYSEAKKEAENAFGDQRVYIEKFIQDARHIEVQVLGDGKGHAVHLYERDCTIQNHNQKLIEEAPASILNEDSRRDILETTAAFARNIKYRSAGTVEFLYLPSEDAFYFMEMNTRIQVEHCVTEMITGIDIVAEQIHVAFDEELTVQQEDIHLQGVAMEVRVNAEDPERNFSPSPGPVDQLHFGKGRNVRIDSHIYPGYTISPYYDAMIAKIIVQGKDREDVIARMSRVLDETVIGPIKTNLAFQRFLMDHPQFRSNDYDIHFLDKNNLV